MRFDGIRKALIAISPSLVGDLKRQANSITGTDDLEEQILDFASALETRARELDNDPKQRIYAKTLHDCWIELGAAFFEETEYFMTLNALVSKEGQTKEDPGKMIQRLIQLNGLPKSKAADDFMSVLVWSVAAAMSSKTAEPGRVVMLAEALAPYTAEAGRNGYVAASLIGAICRCIEVEKSHLGCSEENRDRLVNYLIMSCIVGHPERIESAFNDLKDWFCRSEERLRKIDILYRCHTTVFSIESKIIQDVTNNFLQKLSPFSEIENHHALLKLLKLACNVQNQPLADTLANKILASKSSPDDQLTAVSYYKQRWSPEHSEIKQHLNKLMLSHGLQKLSPSDKHTPAINLIKHEQDKLNNRNWFFVAASAAVCSSVIILDSCAKVNIAHMAALALKSSLLGAGAVLSVQALCTWHKEGRGIKALSQLALGLAAVTCSVITLGQADAACMLANKALLGAAGICLLGWAVIDALEIKWIRSEGACSNGNQKPLTPSVHPA